jgi:hypothetical protein
MSAAAPSECGGVGLNSRAAALNFRTRTAPNAPPGGSFGEEGEEVESTEIGEVAVEGATESDTAVLCIEQIHPEWSVRRVSQGRVPIPCTAWGQQAICAHGVCAFTHADHRVSS